MEVFIVNFRMHVVIPLLLYNSIISVHYHEQILSFLDKKMLIITINYSIKYRHKIFQL